MSGAQPPLLLFGLVTAGRALRSMAAIVSAICMIGFLAPSSLQGVVGSMVSNARNPVLAMLALRSALAGAAVLLAGVALGWPIWMGWAACSVRWILTLRARKYAGLVVMAAATVRVLIALIPTDLAVTDPQWYHATAVSLANGEGFAFRGALTAYRPPGYSSLLALSYTAFGHHPMLVWVWGILATALLLVATNSIALRLYGMSVARVATLGVAAYPALAIFTALPTSDLVFTAGLTGLLCWIVAHEFPRWPASFLLGIILGMLTLTRNVGIAFAGPIAFAWWVKRPRPPLVIWQIAVLAGALALPLAGWMARNYTVFGTATLATNTGTNLLVGNHAGASGAYPVQAKAPFGLVSVRGLNEAEADRLYFDQAVDFARHHPGAWLALLPRKLLHLFAFELTGAQWLLHERRYPSWFKYGIYAISQLSYLLLLALVSLRILSFSQRLERPQGLQWTGWTVGATVVLTTLVAFGQDRFRMPFLPWMIIEASVILVRLAESPPLVNPSFISGTTVTREHR